MYSNLMWRLFEKGESKEKEMKGAWNDLGDINRPTWLLSADHFIITSIRTVNQIGLETALFQQNNYKTQSVFQDTLCQRLFEFHQRLLEQ